MKSLFFKKNAIALLITIFFIMLITISIGVGLKFANDASKTMKSELFLFQNSILIEDILAVLKKSPDLEKVKTPEDLYMFLETTPAIPFESNGLEVLIEIQSARSKINPNSFTTKEKKEIFENFLMSKMINTQYAMMLYDLIGKIKPDGGYNTDIFNENSRLFRDYIVSEEHLGELQKIYEKKYRESSLQDLNFKELFYIAPDLNGSTYSIDINYATPLAWEFMLGCDEQRALGLYEKEEVYTEENLNIYLSEDEVKRLVLFNYGNYVPLLDIKVTIMQKDRRSNIRFEYNIQEKKGSNFVFEV